MGGVATFFEAPQARQRNRWRCPRLLIACHLPGQARQRRTLAKISRRCAVAALTVAGICHDTGKGLDRGRLRPRRPNWRVARNQDKRARWSAVVSLAPEKRLFLNVRRKRLLVSPFGKKLCDINERLNPF